MTARAEIATAATITDLTTVTEFYRQNLQPGQGFVKLGRKARDDSGFGFMDTWQVWIALPQDLAAAEKWLDDHLPTLIAAVAPAMVVTTATPSTLVFDTNSVPGVVIEGAREG